MSNLDKYLEAAVEAARAAGEIQKKYLDKSIHLEFKGVSNIVTEVDIKCEKQIVGMLQERFPDHSFLAEEGGETQPGSECLWIVDPLDGTTNYAHGYHRFCVSIGLSVKGKVMAGAVYNAVADEMFTAVRGGGAHLNGEPIHVSEVGKANDALVCTGLSYNRDRTLLPLIDIYLRILPNVQSLRRDGCAALDFCDVACGRFDAFWELNLNAWDVSAGTLLVEEAGGKWSGLDGKEVDLFAKQFLATNGRIHQEMIDIMKSDKPPFKVEWLWE